MVHKSEIMTNQRGEYIFILLKMDQRTGQYENLGATLEESFATEFLAKPGILKVEVFSIGQLNGPVNVCYNLEEFEDTIL
jgi:hypothetical protein